MKNKYVTPNTEVVSVAVEKHLLAGSEFQIQSGTKSFDNTLSREGSSWDDEE